MPWATITRVPECVSRGLSSLGNELANWDHMFGLIVDQPHLIPMPLLWRLHTRYTDVERISVVEPVLTIVKECRFRDRASRHWRLGRLLSVKPGKRADGETDEQHDANNEGACAGPEPGDDRRPRTDRRLHHRCYGSRRQRRSLRRPHYWCRNRLGRGENATG